MQSKRLSTWRRITLAVVGLLVAVGLSGCFVLSVHPLYIEGQTVFDAGLVGVWRDADAPDDETWQFVDDGKGGYRLIIRVNDSLQIRPGEDGLFAAHLVELGGRLFMDLYPEEPEGVSDMFKSHIVPGHSFWSIERQGEILVLGELDNKALDALTRDHGLDLDLVERDDVTVLTAPTDRLQEVLAVHAGALFPETETLARLQ